MAFVSKEYEPLLKAIAWVVLAFFLLTVALLIGARRAVKRAEKELERHRRDLLNGKGTYCLAVVWWVWPLGLYVVMCLVALAIVAWAIRVTDEDKQRLEADEKRIRKPQERLPNAHPTKCDGKCRIEGVGLEQCAHCGEDETDWIKGVKS